MPLISIQDASLSFSDLEILKNAVLYIKKNERISLIGKNGAGKSTLLKVINKSQDLDHGSIIYQKNIKISYLKQDNPKNLNISIYDFIKNKFKKENKKEINVNEIIEIKKMIQTFEIDKNSLLAELSGGFLRRVVLSSVLLGKPDVLLLDEPTNHLDINTITWLEGFLKKFSGTVLFISHDRSFIQNVCTRIVDLDRGRLTSFPGNYKEFIKLKKEHNRIEKINKKLFDQNLKKEEIWIRKGIKARTTRNEGRVKNLIGVIVRIRNHIFQSLHKFLYQKGYYWIPTPIITGLNTEGAGEMFRVSTMDMKNIPKKTNGSVDFKKDFFGKESFLTVSGQLNLETYACSLSKVYTFGPTFRAENSNTSRHLAEFWMLEIESSFCNLYEISLFAEDMLKYVCKSILKYCMNDIKFLKNYIDNDIINRLESFLLVDFIHINYKDAIDILLNSQNKFENSVSLGIDLNTEHERFLVEKHFKAPIVIINYPKELKAFYMRLNDDKKTVAAMDLLVPGIGELIGGSQREERIEVLDLRLSELGLKQEDYWWYRDLRRYGTVHHSGFGMGFERLISYITGISNIRDVIPFPRTVKNANF